MLARCCFSRSGKATPARCARSSTPTVRCHHPPLTTFRNSAAPAGRSSGKPRPTPALSHPAPRTAAGIHLRRPSAPGGGPARADARSWATAVPQLVHRRSAGQSVCALHEGAPLYHPRRRHEAAVCKHELQPSEWSPDARVRRRSARAQAAPAAGPGRPPRGARRHRDQADARTARRFDHRHQEGAVDPAGRGPGRQRTVYGASRADERSAADGPVGRNPFPASRGNALGRQALRSDAQRPCSDPCRRGNASLSAADRPCLSAPPVYAVSLRDDGDTDAGTKASAMFVHLGEHEATVVERIEQVVAAMGTAKQELRSMSKDAAMAYGVALLGMAELTTATHVDRVTPPLANMVISNVPGARQRMYLNGAPLVGTFPVSAIAMSIGLSTTTPTSSSTIAWISASSATAPPCTIPRSSRGKSRTHTRN